jgi:membrane associated rhomboid family serine protease
MTEQPGTPGPGAPGTPPAGSASPTCYRHPDREALIRCTRCNRPICPECMNEAPVGFHCPDDAAQARRGARRPRTALGAVAGSSTPWVTYTLIAANLLVYLITGLQSSRGINAPQYGAADSLFDQWTLVPSQVADQDRYWTLLTSVFLHLNLVHLGANMLSLYFVGPAVERALGWWRFLALYLVAGLGGGAAVYAFDAGSVVGASGAIFGLLGACLVMARKIGLDLQWLIAIIVLNFVFTFSVAGISRLDHLGGFVTGALLGFALAGPPNRRRILGTGVQVAGIAAVFAAVVVVVIARSATG